MRREQGPGSDCTWTHRLLGLLPHLPSRRSSALLDCCCSVIRVNRPLQLSPHEIRRLHETGRVWNAVSLSLLLLKNPNYQNLSAKMGQKDKADAVAYPLWMSLNNFRRRTGKKKKKHHATSTEGSSGHGFGRFLWSHCEAAVIWLGKSHLSQFIKFTCPVSFWRIHVKHEGSPSDNSRSRDLEMSALTFPVWVLISPLWR